MLTTQRQSKNKYCPERCFITHEITTEQIKLRFEHSIFYFEGERLNLPSLNQHHRLEKTAKKWQKIRKKGLNLRIPVWLACFPTPAEANSDTALLYQL